MGELEWCVRGVWLKGRKPYPPDASGSDVTFLASRCGEESMKYWFESCETGDCGQTLRCELFIELRAIQSVDDQSVVKQCQGVVCAKSV